MIDVKEDCFVEKEDWRWYYINYLLYKQLPEDVPTSIRVKHKVERYFMKENQLYRRSFQGKAMKCLGPNEVEEVLREIYAPNRGSHLGRRRLLEQLISMDYFWPTMESDSIEFVRCCEACQKLGNLIYMPTVEIRNVTSPCPFHTWSMDLIGPISPPSRRKIWILATTENFTKWSEAISLKKATSEALREFVLSNIICRFGIPRRILSDNGTPFISQPFELLLEEYQIYHGKSTRYYPKGNGSIEAFNKTLQLFLER